jgi:hypothetical protein
MATITPIPPAARFQDLTGQRFGRLIVLGWAAYLPSRPNAAWVCRCDCGSEKTVIGGNLIAGRTRSCGCLNLENLSKAGSATFLARGTKRHPEYKIWAAMLGRCHNPNNRQFPDYGGRGIAVCDRWRFGESGSHGFNLFLLDMGSRPTGGHTIDRTDNDRGYSPDNCAWRSRTEQARNRRNTLMVHFNGADMPLAAACELTGMPYRFVYLRIRYGMPVERALTQPKR